MCKKCDSLINASAWNKRDFIYDDDLLEKKSNALSLGKINNLSLNIVNDIEMYFDEYLNVGFIKSINGKAGQSLKFLKITV